MSRKRYFPNRRFMATNLGALARTKGRTQQDEVKFCLANSLRDGKPDSDTCGYYSLRGRAELGKHRICKGRCAYEGYL